MVDSIFKDYLNKLKPIALQEIETKRKELDKKVDKDKITRTQTNNVVKLEIKKWHS